MNSERRDQVGAEAESVVLHRHLRHTPLHLAQAEGNRLVLQEGRAIFDASGGAAVTCIGHGDRRVVEAVARQTSEVAYCASICFTTRIYEELSRFLVDSTRGQMARAYIVNSGSEAMEAAMKLARQYFLEKIPAEPQRTRFISRRYSYHGITLGSLSMGGHQHRREKFEPLLLDNISRVSPCFAYRFKNDSETDQQYVARLATELDEEFQRVGAETVCAFVVEPVVGAALGCVPSVPGYFQAMQAVCRKYGALLIFDEVMSGMGRTGTVHAWEQEGVVPDIQTIGKCLGGGYQPVAGLLANHQVMDAFIHGTATFVHGHTYQGHPVGCAAALEVQQIIQAENLLENVNEMGRLLSQLLTQRLGDHPNVGDIRGRGLFWGIEFVSNKATGLPFSANNQVAMKLYELGLTNMYGIMVYPGSGTVDGVDGDHIILAPAYNISSEDVTFIANTVERLVKDFFATLEVIDN